MDGWVLSFVRSCFLPICHCAVSSLRVLFFVSLVLFSFVPSVRFFFQSGSTLTPHVGVVTHIRLKEDGQILLTVTWLSRWRDLFAKEKRAVKNLTNDTWEHDNEVFRTQNSDEDVPAESVLGRFGPVLMSFCSFFSILSCRLSFFFSFVRWSFCWICLLLSFVCSFFAWLAGLVGWLD